MIEEVRKVIVVDLDGTLADCTNRSHLAQQGLWDDFNALCEKDSAYADMLDFMHMADTADTHSIIICTGREEKWRDKTLKWLKRYQLWSIIDDLLMRPEGNFAPDAEIKIQLLESHFGSKEEVLNQVSFCIDDRDKVVDGLRAYGLTCLQIRPGGY